MFTVITLMHLYVSLQIFCCLPTGYIQASRALMIASIVFGTFGLVATLAGMQCSKIGGENYVLKGRIAAIGGVFFLLQGKDLEVDAMAMFRKKGLENVRYRYSLTTSNTNYPETVNHVWYSNLCAKKTN